MSRKFITTIVAGAIAVTGLTAAQAQAGDRDIARLLAGATALVIIGKALSDENKNRPRVITRGHAYKKDHNWNGRGYGHRLHDHAYERERARREAYLRAQREEAHRRARLEEARRQARLEEARREARRAERYRAERREDQRRAERRQQRHHDNPAYARDSGRIQPRPLPDRVRRHNHHDR